MPVSGPTAVAIGAAVFSAAATVYGVNQQNKAAEAAAKNARKVENLQQKRADVTTARARAKQVREARIKRAQAIAQGQGDAGSGGSGLVGAQANISGSLNNNIAFLNKNQAISTEISNLNISSAKSSAKHGSRANNAAAASTVFDTAASLTRPA